MRLNLQSRGIIKSGFIEYSFSEDGMALFDGQLVVKLLFLKKTIPFKGTEQLNPELLKSSNWLMVGTVMDFLHAKATILNITAHLATINVDIPGYGSGIGVLDLSQEMISIQSIDVKVSVAGHNVEIVAA